VFDLIDATPCQARSRLYRLERIVREMVANKKSGKVKGCKMNSTMAGIDLGDKVSWATVLSPIGDVADTFSFPMNEEGYAYLHPGF